MIVVVDEIYETKFAFQIPSQIGFPSTQATRFPRVGCTNLFFHLINKCFAMKRRELLDLQVLQILSSVSINRQVRRLGDRFFAQITWFQFASQSFFEKFWGSELSPMRLPNDVWIDPTDARRLSSHELCWSFNIQFFGRNFAFPCLRRVHQVLRPFFFWNYVLRIQLMTGGLSNYFSLRRYAGASSTKVCKRYAIGLPGGLFIVFDFPPLFLSERKVCQLQNPWRNALSQNGMNGAK